MKYIIGLHGDSVPWTHDPNIGIVSLKSSNLAHYEAERATRKKYGGKELFYGDFSQPREHFKSYLESIGISLDDVAAFAFVANTNPYGFELPGYREFISSFLDVEPKREFDEVFRDVFLHRTPKLKKGLFGKPTYVVKHHTAHSAYTFFTSPFEKAFTFSYDGGGYNTLTQICQGNGRSLSDFSILPNHWFGWLYKRVTDTIMEYFQGKKPNYGAEGKAMALASYGQPLYLETIKTLLRNDHITGGYNLALQPIKTYTNHFLYGPMSDGYEGDERFQFAANYASSWQAFFEESVISLLDTLKEKYPFENLCITGGCGLNGVLNYRLRHKFKNVWISPATSDSGLGLGAALFVAHQIFEKEKIDYGNVAYCGHEYDIKETIIQKFDEFQYEQLSESSLADRVARELAAGKIVGWFQGRSESGPRALGNRSILCDPRNVHMRDVINEKVKHRESFRPFAPSMLRERTKEYFDADIYEPYMLTIAKANEKAIIDFPAAIHVDGTARIQTVDRSDNKRYYDLISAFERITRVPVLLNTSFNDAGEPIVESPEDALKSFVKMDIDLLILGDFIVQKKLVYSM